MNNQKNRNRTLRNKPFNELDKIGFSKYLLHEKTKWRFTEVTKAIEIDEFEIICDYTKEYQNELQFKTYVFHNSLNSNKLKDLQNRFYDLNILLENGMAIKLYDLKESSIAQINEDLIAFAKLLRKENFRPNTDF